MINYHIEELYQTTEPNFSQFFFSHWLLHKCFFSFLIKTFAGFEKLIRFHRQAFIVYKNGENLKILIEIFCQKLTVSNVILAFLDHLKPKFFCRATMVASIERFPASLPPSPPPFENIWIHLCRFLYFSSKCSKSNSFSSKKRPRCFWNCI